MHCTRQLTRSALYRTRSISRLSTNRPVRPDNIPQKGRCKYVGRTPYFYAMYHSTKRIIFCLAMALLCPALLWAQGGKQITPEDLWKKNTFKIKDVPGF